MLIMVRTLFGVDVPLITVHPLLGVAHTAALGRLFPHKRDILEN